MNKETAAEERRRLAYKARIENEFMRRSLSEPQQGRCDFIRDKALALAKAIAGSCSAGEERDAAIRLLREVVMWANAAIEMES